MWESNHTREHFNCFRCTSSTSSWIIRRRINCLPRTTFVFKFGISLSIHWNAYNFSFTRRTFNGQFASTQKKKQSLFYCVPTLHNPTGYSWSVKEKKNLYNTCKELQIPIIEDDVYHAPRANFLKYLLSLETL